MDTCPNCQQQTLVYEPYTRSAKCRRIECGYREKMDHTEYSKKFEQEDRNLARKLSFPLSGTITLD